jgi:hypothetical protein
VPLRKQCHNNGEHLHIHTHKINIKHLNSTLINTKLPASDTRVNTWITMYTTISTIIYKREYRRRNPPPGASVHGSTSN